MINIELKNEQEAQVLINFIDIAVKTKGIEAAEAAIYFTKAIAKAIEESKKESMKNDNTVSEG